VGGIGPLPTVMSLYRSPEAVFTSSMPASLLWQSPSQSSLEGVLSCWGLSAAMLGPLQQSWWAGVSWWGGGWGWLLTVVEDSVHFWSTLPVQLSDCRVA